MLERLVHDVLETTGQLGSPEHHTGLNLPLKLETIVQVLHAPHVPAAVSNPKLSLVP